MPNKDLIFTILGIDRGSPAFNKVGDSAERAGDRVDKAGMLAIKTMAGVAAAGVASGAAVGVALGGIPVLFAGIAAAAVSSNAEVQDSFRNLRDNVVDDVQAMAEPLVDDFVGAANDIGKAWGRDVAPVMRSIFADPAMGRGVRELAAGVGDFAGNAMPGFLTAVRASEPVMTGFRSALGSTGTGLSDFATNTSRSSESAGRVITGLGNVVEDVLGDVGTLLGDLSDAVGPQMGQVEKAIDQTTDSVLGLAQGALPILSSASGASLGVLNSVLGVLEPISSQLGTGVGLTLAAAGGWRLLTAAGNAYTNLDLGGKVERTALSAGILTESLTGSATAGERVATTGSRLGAVLRGVGTAIPFVGVAAVAMTLALDASNKSMQQAEERGRSLGESLIKGGSEADRARLQIERLTTENSRYQSQLEDLERRSLGAGKASSGFAVAIDDLHTKIDTNNATIDSARSKYKEIRDSLTGAELKQVEYNEAVAKYGTNSQQAAAAGSAWRAALDEEERKARAAGDAIKTHNDRIIEAQNIMLGAAGAGLNYRAALLDVESAQKGVNDAVATHGRDSFEARQAMLAYEQSLHGAITALGEKVQAENAGKSASEQARLVSQAQATEILRLAAAAGENAPASLMNMVRSLDATTLAAIGVTGKVTETGDAIFNLPDGKTVVIKGDNEDAKKKITEINNMSVHDKTLFINYVTAHDSKTAVGFGDPGRAAGGPMDAGRSYRVGEDGVERFVPDEPGVMLTRTQTSAVDRAMRMARAGLERGGGGGGDRHYHLTVVNAGGNAVDLKAQFDRLELAAFPDGR